MNKQCCGCGIELQDHSPNKVGYVTEKALLKDNIYCKRCFDIKHYNKSNQIILDDREYYDMLRLIPKESLVILVVDLFDLSATLNSAMTEILRHHQVLLAVNKVDLFPQNLNFEKLLQRLRKAYLDLGIRVLDGTLVSAKYDFNIDYFYEMIEEYREGHNAYIVGVSNTGKSSFVMQLLKFYNLSTKIMISEFPATTLKFLANDVGDFIIYDTPGLINRGQMIHYIAAKDYHYIFPKQTLKPKTYQLSLGESLLIGGLAKVNIKSSEKVSLTCYFAEDMPFHRTKRDMREFYLKHRGMLLQPVYLQEQWKAYNLYVEGGQEIALSGFGFISVNKSVELEFDLHQDVQITLRRRLI